MNHSLEGGAVTFWMEPERGTVNDINPPKLINFYVVVRDHVDELIEDAKTHKNEKRIFLQGPKRV